MAPELVTSRNLDGLESVLSGYADAIESTADNLARVKKKQDQSIPPAIIGRGQVWDIRAFPSLDSAIAAFGSDVVTLYITKEVSVAANTTIPSNISIEVLKGGSFAISTGVTLTINGPFSAGMFQVFFGDGLVTLSKGSRMYPEWWGAVSDDAADDWAGIQAALDCAGRSDLAQVVLSSPTVYRVESTLTIPSGVWLRGRGRRLGGLKFYTTSADPSIIFDNGYYQTLSDLNIDHDSQPDSGPAILFQDNDGVGGSDPAQYTNCYNLRIVRHTAGVRCNAESTWLTFTDVNVEFCDTAFSISLANLAEFHRCIANGNESAWYIDRTAKLTMRHCTAQVCSSTTIPAIQVVDSDNTIIDNLWCERNEFTNLLIKGSGSGLTPTSRLTVVKDCRLSGAGFTSGLGRGLDIGANSFQTTVIGGWYGDNAQGDIRINSGSTGNTIIEPRVTSGSVSISDAAADTHYFSKEKFQIYTQALLNAGALVVGTTEVRGSGLGAFIETLYARNTSAAVTGGAAANQAWAPGLHGAGAGWKTNATAASQAVEYRLYGLPIEGTASPTLDVILETRINGGSWVEQCRWRSGLTAAFAGSVTAGGLPVSTYVARGSVTLVAGVGTVADANVTANTIVRYWVYTPGGTQGFLSYANNAGVGFTINSTSATDTSVVQYEIVSY